MSAEIKKPNFDRGAQLQFGSAIGSLLRETADRYDLRHEDLIGMMAAVVAGWAIDARMSRHDLLQLIDQSYRGTQAAFAAPPPIKVI